MAQVTSGIGLKKAVDSAVKAAHDYYAGQELHNMLLEEVEMAENKKAWLVTLGFNVPMTTPEWHLPHNLLAPRKSYRRLYKIFNVDAASGEVRSMKHRDL